MNKRVHEAMIKFELAGWSILRVDNGVTTDVYVCMGKVCALLGTLTKEVA